MNTLEISLNLAVESKDILTLRKIEQFLEKENFSRFLIDHFKKENIILHGVRKRDYDIFLSNTDNTTHKEKEKRFLFGNFSTMYATGRLKEENEVSLCKCEIGSPCDEKTNTLHFHLDSLAQPGVDLYKFDLYISQEICQEDNVDLYNVERKIIHSLPYISKFNFSWEENIFSSGLVNNHDLILSTIKENLEEISFFISDPHDLRDIKDTLTLAIFEDIRNRCLDGFSDKTCNFCVLSQKIKKKFFMS